jgi:hypothetical protein
VAYKLLQALLKRWMPFKKFPQHAIEDYGLSTYCLPHAGSIIHHNITMSAKKVAMAKTVEPTP